MYNINSISSSVGAVEAGEWNPRKQPPAKFWIVAFGAALLDLLRVERGTITRRSQMVESPRRCGQEPQSGIRALCDITAWFQQTVEQAKEVGNELLPSRTSPGTE